MPWRAVSPCRRRCMRGTGSHGSRSRRAPGLVERALEEAGIAQPSDQLVDHALRAVAADVRALHLDRVKSAEPSHAVIATVLSVPVRADEIEPSSEEVREIDRSLSPDASEADRAKRIASLRARRVEDRK